MSITRCSWCQGDPLYEQYHDEEWGVPVHDEQGLFERLVLEGMQAGLSWLTVLRKREHMRSRFFDFAVDKLAAADARTLASWLQDPGLIRHRGKLVAMVKNAGLVQTHEDFSHWVWSFAPTPKRTPSHRTLASIPSQTEESTAMSKALKKAGFGFVGPTTCYAFMQSVGMVNDHVAKCWRQPVCADLLSDSKQQI